MRPDRVVIGTDSERARAVMRQLYRPLYLIETPILFTGIETAELIKYAANAFLATKITFINEIADRVRGGGRRRPRRRPRHRPRRPHRPQVSPCRAGLWRLVLSQGHAARWCAPPREAGAPWRIVETVVAVNEARKRRMADSDHRVACGGSARRQDGGRARPDLQARTPTTCATPRAWSSCRALAAWRAPPSSAFDPEGMDEARKLMPDLVYCQRRLSRRMTGADALVHPDRVERVPRRSICSACANACASRLSWICATSTARPTCVAAGFIYHGIGRPSVAGQERRAREMSGPHRFNPTVLREYDVRGVVGETLSKDDAYAARAQLRHGRAPRQRQDGLRRL